MKNKLIKYKPGFKSYHTVEVFKQFQEKYPEYTDIDLAMFKKIIRCFNCKIRDGIIENREGIDLLYGLGYIFMGSCPPPKTKKNIDYKLSKELGKKVSFRNWETDNTILKIFYTNYTTKVPFENQELWTFKASTDFKRMASKAYLANWTKYIKVDSFKKISSMFREYKRRESKKKIRPIIPADYNEFNM